MTATLLTQWDKKAIVAIAVLDGRREHRQTITYTDLAQKLGLMRHGLGDVLDRVGSWCRKNGKHSLALLVVTKDGWPERGVYVNPVGALDPVTPETYGPQKASLLQEDWTDLSLPCDPREVADAYAEEWHPTPALA